MCSWVIPLLISSFSWGTSDTICDAVIEGGDHSTKVKPIKTDPEEANTTVSTIDEDGADVDDKYQKGDKTKKHSLTSYQTVFIAVIIDYVALFFYFSVLYIWNDQYRSYVGKSSFIFKEKYDYTFYMALTSGAFSYLAFHFMTKAWESSSSTIILPLLQFPSIIVFFASAIPKYFMGLPWLVNKLHILAYAILFFGGLLPATKGNVTIVFRKEFWNQPVVKMAISSELCHGVYNLLISSGEDSVAHDPNVHWLVTHFEFFAITRISYILACCAILCFDKQYRTEIVGLKYVSRKPLLGAYAANGLGFIGYIASSRAYQCYYQTGVVTAAESALNQLLNLLSAYVLKRFYNLGRDDSLKGMKVKISSAFIIMFGLYLAS